MIKINLLPAFVKERKIVRKLLMLVFILLGLELLAFSYWYNRVSTEGYRVNQELETLKAQAQEVQNLQNEAQTIRSEIEPIKAKTKFIEDTMNFPVKLADLLDSIRRYTYAKVTYTSLQLGSGGGMAGGGMMGMMGKGPMGSMGGMPGSGGGAPPMMSGMPGMMGGGPGGGGQEIRTVSIQGFTNSVEDVARYLQNLLRCPKIADVQLSGIPGYGSTGGAMPGMGGGMPGMMGKGPMGGMPGMMGGMPGMMPPASGGMTSQAGGPINISVICYLMEPLTPPTPPTAAAAAAPTAGGMMPPMVGMGAPGALPQAGAPQAAPGAKAPAEGRGGGLPGLQQRREMEQEIGGE
ncbi:hypothetical protein H5T88_00660 [bacterium]|nr:hypothetical protein [bacterium]